MSSTTATLAELPSLKGKELGTSEWFEIRQERVNTFADATDDHQWIHVDVAAAKKGPFGGPIAHGFLTLSLFVPMWSQILIVSDMAMGINYGLNKVRFPAAVPVGSRVRATMRLQDLTESERGSLAVLHTTVEADGIAKPVCVAELAVLLIPDESLTTTTP
jgi:acyl dehydratase